MTNWQNTLYLAALSNDPILTDSALFSGADPNRPYSGSSLPIDKGTMPLEMSAKGASWRKAETMGILLRNGARPPEDRGILHHLQHAPDIFLAVLRMYTSILPEDECTILACSYWGREDIMREMLARGANVSFTASIKPHFMNKRMSGATAMHIAAQTSPEITKALLEAGAKPDVLDAGGNRPEDISTPGAKSVIQSHRLLRKTFSNLGTSSERKREL